MRSTSCDTFGALRGQTDVGMSCRSGTDLAHCHRPSSPSRRSHLVGWEDLKWPLMRRRAVRHCDLGTATCADGPLIAETHCSPQVCRSGCSLRLTCWHSSYQRHGSEDQMSLARCSSLRRTSQPIRGGSGSRSQSRSGEADPRIVGCGCDCKMPFRRIRIACGW